MNSQKQSTQNGLIADPWSDLSDEERALLSSAGVGNIVPADTQKEVQRSLQNSAMVRDLRNMVFNTPDQSQEIQAKPVRRSPAVRDTRSKLDPTLSSLIFGFTCLAVTVGMAVHVSNQSPNTQVLRLAEMYERSSSASLNANAAIADRAVSEAGTDLTACLWGCGGSDAPETKTVQSPSVSLAVPSQPERQPVGVIPNTNTLNIRNSPNGQVINTIPSGDSISVPSQVTTDGEWALVRWNESNLEGWVSYPLVETYYNASL